MANYFRPVKESVRRIHIFVMTVSLSNYGREPTSLYV